MGDLAPKIQLMASIESLLGKIGHMQAKKAGRVLKPLGFTQSTFAVLQFVIENEPTRVSDMADRMEMNQPGLSKIVQRLTSEGLIQAKNDAHDARITVLGTTAQGKTKFNTVYSALRPVLESTFRQWNVTELQNFHQHLERLTDHLKTHRE